MSGWSANAETQLPFKHCAAWQERARERERASEVHGEQERGLDLLVISRLCPSLQNSKLYSFLLYSSLVLPAATAAVAAAAAAVAAVRLHLVVRRRFFLILVVPEARSLQSTIPPHHHKLLHMRPVAEGAR